MGVFDFLLKRGYQQEGNRPRVELQEELQSLRDQVQGLQRELDEAKAWKSLFDEPPERQQYILASVVSKALRTKKEMVREVDQYKGTYMYNAVVDLLVEDSLAPASEGGNIVTLTSDNSKIRRALDELQERVDLDRLVDHVIEDLLGYGEYTLRVVMDEKGVKEVVDDVEQDRVVAVYSGWRPLFFLIHGGGTMVRTQYRRVPPTEFLHFCLGRRRLRILVEGQNVREYVRVGRSVFHGVLDILRHLSIMSALVPAQFLQRLTKGSIIGLTVPESMSATEALDACRRYEQLLNRTLRVDQLSGTLSVSDVLSAAGRFKVVPVYGGERGSLQKMDPRFEEQVDINVVEDMRKSLCATLGIPYSFIFGSEGGSPKGELLKSFSRYVRKLYGIRMAVRQALIQLALRHLERLGYMASPQQVQVRFESSLIQVEELDKIEFLDTMMNTLGNIVNQLTTVADSVGGTLDGDVLVKFLDSYFRLVGLKGVVKVRKGGTTTTPTATGGGGMGL